MAKVDSALVARCLADVESGHLTLEECLAAHPAVAGELRELLAIAFSIAPPPAVTPSPAFRSRGRAALLAALAPEKEAVTTSAPRRLWDVMIRGRSGTGQLLSRRLQMPAVVAAIIIALTTATGGGAVYASQDALPGDALYQVKTSVEGLQLALATTDEAKAETHLYLAGKRLAEIQRADASGRTAAASAAADAFSDEVDLVDDLFVQAVASGKDVTDLTSRFSIELTKHETALAAIEARVPDQAKPAVAKAARKAAGGLALGRGHADASAADKGRAPSATPPAGVSLGITQAISDVQTLADDASVPGRSYNGLLAKLRAADAALERGQTQVALNVLNAFYNDLSAMRREDHISGQNYDTLYSRYTALVASLGGSAKPQVTPEPKAAGATVTPEPDDDGGGKPGGNGGKGPKVAPPGRSKGR